MPDLGEAATWIDVLGALGMASLAVPAFGLNARKKALARISEIVRTRRARGDTGALDRIAEELEAESARRVGEWRRADEICLYAGYFLLLAAALGRVFV